MDPFNCLATVLLLGPRVQALAQHAGTNLPARGPMACCQRRYRSAMSGTEIKYPVQIVLEVCTSSTPCPVLRYGTGA
eukprot:1033877-Rhodomonas_salina.1